MFHQSSRSCSPTIDINYAERLLKSLKDLAWTEHGPNRGMNCYGYSVDEQAAIDLVVSEARQLGMEAFQDRAGNVYLIKRGTDATRKARMMVSHLDTVPGGGAHDGRDGIVAGLAIVQAINQSRIRLKHDLCIMIARSEESAVNNCFSLGAKLATGQIDARRLIQIRDNQGKSVCSKIVSCRLNVDEIFESAPLIPTGQDAGSLVQSLLEIHIEQGKWCDSANADVCIVNAIRGNTRFLDCSIKPDCESRPPSSGPERSFAYTTTYPAISIRGEAAHSGAAFEEDRADAVREAVSLLGMAQDWCDGLNRDRQTVKLVPLSICTTNRSLSTIPDNATLGFRIEAHDRSQLELFCARMTEWVEARSVANQKITFSGIEPAPVKIAGEPIESYPALSGPIEAYLSLMLAAEGWFQEQRRLGKDVVFTPSIVQSDGTAREIKFSFEIRSTDQEVLAGFSDYMQGCNEKLRGCVVTLTKPIITNAVTMDENLIQTLISASGEMPVGVTPSGAGHDASTLAQAGYCTVMIFIKQPNPISHNPAEAHDSESFRQALLLGMKLMLTETEAATEVRIGESSAVSLVEYLRRKGGLNIAV